MNPPRRGPARTRVDVTQSMTNEHRRTIREHLAALAALYQYHPERP